MEFFPCEQTQVFGVLYAEGFEPFQEITLWLQNETKNFLFIPSHCLLPVSIWRTTSGMRAAGAAPCTPQVFHCPPNSFLLPHKAERHPQPEAHRQKTPLAFLVHLLLISVPHGAPQQSPRQARFHKSCCLQSPTLIPNNNLCVLSTPNICPKSETHTNDFREQHSFWGSLTLLKLLKDSAPFQWHAKICTKPCRSPFVVYSTKLAILCPILIFFLFYSRSKGENVSTQFCDSLKPGWIHCRKKRFYPFLLWEEQAEE